MTNEQRAHDLAICVLKDSLKPNKQEYLAGKQSPKTPYATYLELYNEFLKNFNRDFPK